MKDALAAGIALMGSAIPLVAAAEPVLLISIDGLQPADVIEAEKRGLAVPNLRRFVTQGTFASAVIGNLPTVTYPSHTTLLTGVAPARHGIVGNTTFDPTQINQAGWYWYAADIKVPTLWDAAAKAGLTSANVHWPVSVGASSVRWNLPQIWRTGHDDDARLLAALSSPGLVGELEADAEKYAPGIDESIAGDENRARFAVRLIGRHKPDFMTVYLTALDHEQHAFGPDTRQAHAVLERIDRAVGNLVTAQMNAHPDAVVAVVSDHGFAATDTEINLFRPFIDAGLITLDDENKVTGWEAMPWPSGGSIAVVLVRPGDQQLVARVRGLLDRLKADPAARIDSIADTNAIAAMGGNPQASFYINLGKGALAGGFKDAPAGLSRPARSKGMHGYFPAAAAMRSSFMLMGKSIPAGRKLGEIDMRAIAPTLARILKVSFPTAELPPVSLAPR